MDHDSEDEPDDTNLDLENMAIINVESSEEHDLELEGSQGHSHKHKHIPFWDYLPDEVCLRIFAFLTEKKAVEMSGVCKRFAMLTNEEAFWEEKAKGWINTKVTKPEAQGGNLRTHYVKLYKENQVEENRKKVEAEKARRNKAWEKKKKRIKKFFSAYWSVGCMEVPTIIAILLFTIFIALRLDEVIYWDYHLVFLPLYIGMANIFCGMATTDPVHYYLRSHRPATVNNYYPNDSFDTKSTATIIYEELTPFHESPRAKASIFLWWATVLISFVLLAEALNRQGIFNTYWCLVSMIIGIGLLGCCYGSWLPNGDLCSGDKAKGGIFLCFLVFFHIWMAAFFYVKSQFIADFSWYVAFTPWWIIGIGSFFTLGVSWIAFISNRNSSDFWLFAGMIATATIAFITIGAFLILLAYNLEKLNTDEQPFNWIIVITPMIIFEGYSLLSCCALFCYILFK